MQGFVRRTLVIFGGAAGVALLMSTQLLSQPFVWRNWEITEILQAWLDLLWDRLVVAMTMATMLATVGQTQGKYPPAKPGALELWPLKAAQKGCDAALDL